MSGEDRIPTNMRMLLILEALSESAEPLTAAELGRRIGLPKQTIHRLCASLTAEGFLTSDPHEKGVRPARRARALANGLLNASVDAAARRQILKRVSAEVRETVNFAAPRDDGMFYVDRVETDWALRIQLPIGATVPFHCTASGKTYLASLPPARRRRAVMALDLKPWTKATLTAPEALLSELERIARDGYALDREEMMDDMVALAVPVRDAEGRYAASLAFHGPTVRLTLDIAETHLAMMRKAAAELGALLFG